MSRRPQHAQHVILRLPDAGKSLAARVDEADGEVLTLILATAPEGSEYRRGRALIEYTTPRGVHRMSGTLEDRGEAPEVICVRRDGQDDVVQRRDYVRVDAVMPVKVTVDAPARGAARTTTLNLSAGGLMFLDPLGLPFGAEVQVEIELAPGSAPVHAAGRVVRDAGEGVKGVEIESIARQDRERLVRYVSERERAALRLARGG